MSFTHKLSEVRALPRRLYWRGRLSLPQGTPRPHLLGLEETLRHLALSRCSFSRFGDGELRLAFGQGPTVYEQSNPVIARALRHILSGRQQTEALIGFNNTFLKSEHVPFVRQLLHREIMGATVGARSADDLVIAERRWNQKEYRRYFRVILGNEHPVVGDASCFNLSLYVDNYKKGEIEEVRELIRDVLRTEHSVVVRSLSSRETPLEDFLHLQLQLGAVPAVIEVPTKDAGREIDRVRDQLRSFRHEVDTVFFQCGAMATVLAAECHQLVGARGIDLGTVRW